MRLLALITDAWGGRGGIAKVNRDVLTVFAEHPDVEHVTVLPRVVLDEPGTIPEGVDFRTQAAGGAAAFLREFAAVAGRGDYDGIFCGHLHLAPPAAVAAARAGAPWFFIVHGIEGWGPPHRDVSHGAVRMATLRWAAHRADAFVSVSDLTRRRFSEWTGVPVDRGVVVPNGVDLGAYGPGPKRDDLLDRYGLRDRTILLTLARLPGFDRYKGVDEMLEVLPTIAETVPDVAYLVAGDGSDRPRLEAKAASLGIADRVVFAGYIDEAEKADHYRLADAFVMPSRGEGFGLVYLEALACGVPVVASCRDASHEAVLGGELGEVVDPLDPASVVEGVLAALDRPRGVPERLGHFSLDRFAERWRSALSRALTARPVRSHPATS